MTNGVKKTKRILLVVLIFAIVTVLAQLSLLIRYHYGRSAKADDEGLKTLMAEEFSEIYTYKEIVEFRNIYKFSDNRLMAIQSVDKDNRYSYLPDGKKEGWHLFLKPDSLFKNRYRVVGGGEEHFNELAADSQTYYDSKLKKIWSL